MNLVRILLCVVLLFGMAVSADASVRAGWAWPWSHPVVVVPPAPAPCGPVVPAPKPAPAVCAPADDLVVQAPDAPGRHILRATIGAAVKLPAAAVKATAAICKRGLRVTRAVVAAPVKLLPRRRGCD